MDRFDILKSYLVIKPGKKLIFLNLTWKNILWSSCKNFRDHFPMHIGDFSIKSIVIETQTIKVKTQDVQNR